MMVLLCSYRFYINCVYFLSFSTRFVSLFGIQYIIYLFDSEYNEIKSLGLLIKIIELTALIVLIIFAIPEGERKNAFNLIVF